jgi:hypothetical protein
LFSFRFAAFLSVSFVFFSFRFAAFFSVSFVFFSFCFVSLRFVFFFRFLVYRYPSCAAS